MDSISKSEPLLAENSNGLPYSSLYNVIPGGRCSAGNVLFYTAVMKVILMIYSR